MIEFDIRITGTHTLLMHNARLSNPLDPMAKALAEITGKRAKTDDDHEEAARREWMGGLYYEPEVGPYIPGANIERALLDSARMSRLGKSIERGVFIQSDINALEYPGPRRLPDLLADVSFRHMASVKVGRVRVMRCRPMFTAWALTASGTLDESQMDPAELEQTAERAGRLVGLGDWRPRFGRFTASVQFGQAI